jgi:hypothetical protein
VTIQKRARGTRQTGQDRYGPSGTNARSIVLALALIAISLAGCASCSPDSGMDVVRDIAAAELNKEAFKTDTAEKTAAAEGRVRRLLSAPLAANAAVEIALLDNKGLQAAYDDLGMAEAEKVEASLPPNPAFSAIGISTPVELDDEARLAADVLALATLPVRAAIADDRFRRHSLPPRRRRCASASKRGGITIVPSQRVPS